MPPTWVVVQVHDGTGALSIQLLWFNKNTKISPALHICAFLKVSLLSLSCFYLPPTYSLRLIWFELQSKLQSQTITAQQVVFLSTAACRDGAVPERSVLAIGWFSMMHCDDLEGEQRSLAHKSRPLRLLGVSAWPVNLMIEKQALGQTARPLTVAL